MSDPDHSQKVELQCMRLVSDCMQSGSGDLRPALRTEILRLPGGMSALINPEAKRKHELECLRMASDCMQLAGDIRNPDLQRHFLDLSRRLTAAVESTVSPVLSI